MTIPHFCRKDEEEELPQVEKQQNGVEELRMEFITKLVVSGGILLLTISEDAS